MNYLDRLSAIKTINQLATEKIPFLFIASFDTAKNIVIPLNEINPLEIAYDFNGRVIQSNNSNVSAFETSYQVDKMEALQPTWIKKPVSFERYDASFSKLMSHLQSGEIKLANLTFPTEIQCNLTLPEIFARTKAKYRIFLKDHFCSFSPETFVTIQNGTIKTFPMKGTINAGIPNAEQVLLENPKEIDEHETVAKEGVSDIALIASNAHISQFRYVDRITRGDGEILQTSSIIEGTLPVNFHENLGDLLYTILPAGSITGSPRERATEILSELEAYDRGFYSGVAGIFDGENLDSTVLIRYLERDTDIASRETSETNASIDSQSHIETHQDLTLNALEESEILFRYTFKSGGGITAMSTAKSEYDELIEKIYLPIS